MKKRLAIFAIIALPIAVIYRNITGFYFTGEDFSYLWGARHLFYWANIHNHASSDLWYRPIGILLWTLNYRLSPSDPLAHYLINLAIYVIEVALVIRIAEKIGASKTGSILAGIIFAIHPITTSTVEYLAARFDILGALHSLVAIYLYQLSESGSKRKIFALSMLSGTVAMFSKEMYITVPALIFIVAFAETAGALRSRTVFAAKRGALYLIPAAIYFAARMIVLRGMGGYTYKRNVVGSAALELIVNAAKSLLAWPRSVLAGGMQPGVGAWLDVALLVVVAALAVFALMNVRKGAGKAAAVGLMFALVASTPVMNFPDLVATSPRFFHLPLAGMAICLGALCSSKWKAALLAPALLAWLYGSNALSGERLETSRLEKIEVARTIEALLPLVNESPHGTTFVVFGLDPKDYNLDLAMKSMWPEKTFIDDREKIQAYRFIYGDRVSFLMFSKGYGLERGKRKYSSVADYLSDEDFHVQDMDRPYTVESIKVPDIPGEIAGGRPTRVVEYDPNGPSREITDMFARVVEERKNIPLAENLPSWDFSSGAGWAPGGDLKSAGSPGSFVSTGIDPLLTSDAFEILAVRDYSISITMRVKPTGFMPPLYDEGVVSWESSGAVVQRWGMSRTKSFPVVCDGAMREYRVRVGRLPTWYFAGAITELRLDPARLPAEIEIESIRIVPAR